ncbi:hypothetical protein [Clostridium fessum]|uniref:hypothetical protein n=1 Tax=Clostridium fessum TaxID=2126740 RepID=UPI0022E1812A|nr:hypothetical protein [Clostridium fessum]
MRYLLHRLYVPPLSDEQEWFEFKENWFQPEVLGEYVSALSNAAAFHYKKMPFSFGV